VTTRSEEYLLSFIVVSREKCFELESEEANERSSFINTVYITVEITMNFKQQLLVEEVLYEGKILLEQICRGLTNDQTRVIKGVYGEFIPLIEASLTADQVNQLFANVEQAAVAGGKNRSGLGQAVDVAKLPVQAVQKVNDIINKAGQWAQNTAPVKAFDQKFENLKATISSKFPNLSANLAQAGEWAKANPGKTAVIIGVLTAVASLAGGPLGGAIAGQVLRGTAELMKGEKLSTAVGKGIKTAVLGYLSGQAIKMLGDDVVDNISTAGEEAIDQMEKGFREANYADAVAELPKEIQNLLPQIKDTRELIWKGTINRFYFDYNMIMTPENIQKFRSFQNEISIFREYDPEKIAKVIELHAWLKSVQLDPQQGLLQTAKEALKELSNSKELSMDQLRTLLAQHADIDGKVEAIKTASQGAQAAVQAAAAAVEKQKQTVHRASAPAAAPEPPAAGTAVTESKVVDLFDVIESHYDLYRIKQLSNLDEGIGDSIKSAAGSMLGKIQQTGKNLTNRVTADKLTKAWQAAGSPLDSNAIAAILKKSGVDDSIVGSSFQELGIEPPAAATGGDAADSSTAAASPENSPADAATSTAAAADTPSATAPAAAPSAAANQRLTVAQINKIVPKLRLSDLQSLEKVINDTLAKRTAKPTI
jgi:hypothetical protein